MEIREQDVNNWLHFEVDYPPGRRAGAWLNIGRYTRGQIAQSVTYEQLRWVSNRQMTEEGRAPPLAALVHANSRLDATPHWGEGRTSASDVQRFAMPREVLQQTYSTRFSDFALEFYSFVADNYVPFYSTPSNAPIGTRRSSSTVSFTTKATWNPGRALHRLQPLHGDQPRHSPHLRCRGGGSAISSAASECNASLGSTDAGVLVQCNSGNGLTERSR